MEREWQIAALFIIVTLSAAVLACGSCYVVLHLINQ